MSQEKPSLFSVIIAVLFGAAIAASLALVCVAAVVGIVYLLSLLP